MNRLESMLNGQAIIFDTCVMNPHEEISLTELLYNGLSGLSSVHTSMIEDRIHRIDQIKLLLSKPELVVIGEVYKEIKEHFRIISNQSKYLSDLFKRKRDVSSKKLDLLKDYCNDLFHFVSGLRNRDPRVYFSKEHYNILLLMAQNYSKDIRYEESGDKRHLNTPVLIGQKLGTDAHIIATAFTLAYEKDALVFTADKNIAEIIERININILDPIRRTKYGLESNPLYKVSVFNPNLQQN